MVKDQILKLLCERVKQEFSKAEYEPVHDFAHVERVVRNAGLIAEGEKVDPFLPQIAAWLHDIGRPHEKDRPEIPHAQISSEMLHDFLLPFEMDLGKETIMEIREAVSKHSQPNEQDDSWLTVILKDADRIDGLGALGIARNFAYLPDRPLWNRNNPFDRQETTEAFLRNSVKSSKMDGLYRNLEWPDWLRSETAKKITITKVKFMLEFLYQLAGDLGIKREEVDKNEIVQKLKSTFLKK